MDSEADGHNRTSGMNPWRARCGEIRSAGSEGGPGKRIGRNADTASRSDPYTPDMVQTDGILKATVYAGATTTYVLEIAPGVEVSVLEQNLHSARTEERWADGERVRIGWHAKHSLAPLT